MSSPDVLRRLEVVEQQVQELRHSSAVAGLALGISDVRHEVNKLRTEMRDGFAAVRGEVRSEFVEVRREQREFRTEMSTRLGAIESVLQQLLDR